MTIPNNIVDREFKKFEDANGLPAVRVSTGSMLNGVIYDTIDATYPNSVTDIYSFKSGGVTVATITISYTDGSKQNLLSVVRS